MTDEQELRDDIREKLEKHPFNVLTVFKDHYVILVNGKRIAVKNKKIWASIGAAKNALNNYIEFIFRFTRGSNSCGNLSYTEISSIIKQERDAWIQKHVAFVPYGEYAVVAEKIKEIKK